MANKFRSGCTKRNIHTILLALLLWGKKKVSTSIAWIVGKTTTPISSLFGLGTEGLAPRCTERCKSSGLKCTEHTAECFLGSHLARLALTKSTHFFSCLIAPVENHQRKVCSAQRFVSQDLRHYCNSQHHIHRAFWKKNSLSCSLSVSRTSEMASPVGVIDQTRPNLLKTRRWTKMARILRTLKIRRKSSKNRTTLIFSSMWSAAK